MSNVSYSVEVKNRIGILKKTIQVDSDKSISIRSFLKSCLFEITKSTGTNNNPYKKYNTFKEIVIENKIENFAISWLLIFFNFKTLNISLIINKDNICADLSVPCSANL